MKILKYLISICMSKNTNIYTTFWVYIQSHNFKKYAKINAIWKKSFFLKVLSKHASRPFHWLTTYFGKIEKKISIKLKNIIYTTQWHQYILALIYKNTHTHTHTHTHTYTPILLEECAIKQRKIKLKFKENQKIT